MLIHRLFMLPRLLRLTSLHPQPLYLPFLMLLFKLSQLPLLFTELFIQPLILIFQLQLSMPLLMLPSPIFLIPAFSIPVQQQVFLGQELPMKLRVQLLSSHFPTIQLWHLQHQSLHPHEQLWLQLFFALNPLN